MTEKMTFGEDEGCPVCGGFEFMNLGMMGSLLHFRCRGCGAILRDNDVTEDVRR